MTTGIDMEQQPGDEQAVRSSLEAPRRRTKRQKRSKAATKSIWRSRLRRWPMQLAILAGFLAIWQILSGPVIKAFYVSSPSAILGRFWTWTLDGTLIRNGSETLSSAIIGFLIGGVLAVVLGYALGVSHYWSSVIEPFITALWGLPRIALIPLLVIWVGVGQSLGIAIAAILAFFLLFYNTYYGVKEVSQGLIDSVRIMGGGRADIAMRVRFPSALVWIAAGIKMSMPMALVGVVTAEMLASNQGLGFLVQFSANSFDTTGTFAALLALLLLGYGLERLLSLVSARALLWKIDDSR